MFQMPPAVWHTGDRHRTSGLMPVDCSSSYCCLQDSAGCAPPTSLRVIDVAGSCSSGLVCQCSQWYMMQGKQELRTLVWLRVQQHASLSLG
jgi:hypothetical protein